MIVTTVTPKARAHLAANLDRFKISPDFVDKNGDKACRFASVFFKKDISARLVCVADESELENPKYHGATGFRDPESGFAVANLSRFFRHAEKHGIIPIEASFAALLVHEFGHLFDQGGALETRRTQLADSYGQSAFSMAAKMLLVGTLPFTKHWTKQISEFEKIPGQIDVLKALLEGRSTRLAWMFLENELNAATAADYVKNHGDRLPIYYEAACFIKYLEDAFGIARGWRMTEVKPPESLTEIHRPKTYAHRVSAEDYRGQNPK